MPIDWYIKPTPIDWLFELGRIEGFAPATMYGSNATDLRLIELSRAISPRVSQSFASMDHIGDTRWHSDGTVDGGWGGDWHIICAHDRPGTQFINRLNINPDDAWGDGEYENAPLDFAAQDNVVYLMSRFLFHRGNPWYIGKLGRRRRMTRINVNHPFDIEGYPLQSSFYTPAQFIERATEYMKAKNHG